MQPWLAGCRARLPPRRTFGLRIRLGRRGACPAVDNLLCAFLPRCDIPDVRPEYGVERDVRPFRVPESAIKLEDAKVSDSAGRVTKRHTSVPTGDSTCERVVSGQSMWKNFPPYSRKPISLRFRLYGLISSDGYRGHPLLGNRLKTWVR